MDRKRKLNKKEFKQQARLGVVGILGCFCLICLSSEPINEEAWFSLFFVSKSIAFAFGIACYSLFKYWNKRGLLPKTEYENGEY